MRKLKGLIATILVIVLTICMNAFVFAADDIVLNGDEAGASSFMKEFSASGAEYKYLGFVTTKEATSEYNKLQLTYKGDISCLRIEFNRQEDDSNEGPYWFEQEQALHFVISEGKLDLNPSDWNTITIDLTATGIDIGEFWGMHLHYLDPNMQDGSFTVKDARFIADASTPAGGSEGNGSQGSGTNSSSGEENVTTASNSISVSGGTEGTAGGSTDAPSTGSVVWPIAIACGGIVVAVLAFVGSKKLKEE